MLMSGKIWRYCADVACGNGRTDVVIGLLNRPDIDINAVDDDGLTALMIATETVILT